MSVIDFVSRALHVICMKTYIYDVIMLRNSLKSFKMADSTNFLIKKASEYDRSFNPLK